MLQNLVNANLPLILFPLLPLIAVLLSLVFKYSFNRDITVIAIISNSILQLITGLILIVLFYDFEGFYTVFLSEWQHSIQLSFDSNRVYFLGAYLMPVLLTIFHHHKLPSYNIRMLFLFFSSGCSGLIVSGDIFNFYVFYEVMIMSAYILIAVNKSFFASIKYMIFGAASSAIFLAGIILLYASGSYFSYASIYNNIVDFHPTNIQFILLFFSVAFLIKAAFFPVSGWVATCHSATNSLISSFLASFTIFSGIMGLFYFVIIPAELLDYVNMLRFIKVLSILTILISPIVLFFEPNLKRCIAGSTIFTIGFVGFFLASGYHKLALTYVTVHATYKSFMFLVYDDLKIKNYQVTGKSISIALFITTIFFTAGLFPALPYFLKYNYPFNDQLLKFLVYFPMFIVLGSFFKFHYMVRKMEIPIGYYILFPLILMTYYLLFPFSWSHSGTFLLIDAALLLLTYYFGKYIFNKLIYFECLDTKYIYVNINHELLYIVILFIANIVFMRIVS